MPDTQPTAAAMEAATRLYWDKINGVEDADHPGGAVPVIVADIAAALDAYAAEQCSIRHAGRAILAEAERDAALARVETAKAEANRIARLADSECDRRVATEERVQVLEAALRELAVCPLCGGRRGNHRDYCSLGAALDAKAAADEGRTHG